MTMTGGPESHSRINLTPKTSDPPSSKVTASTAHGASMEQRGSPDGWTTFGHGAGSARGMFLDDYGKSGQKQRMPSLSFAPGRTKGQKL